MWGWWTLSHFRRTCYISPAKMSSTTENAAVLIIESTTPVRQGWTGSGWPITSQSNMTPWRQLQPLTWSSNLKQREVLRLLQSGAEFFWFMRDSLNPDPDLSSTLQTNALSHQFLWGSLSVLNHIPWIEQDGSLIHFPAQKRRHRQHHDKCL